MKKIVSTPPRYFNLSILLIVLSYFAFSEMAVMKYPANLAGIVFILLGVFLVVKSWIYFKKNNTPENFENPSFFIKEGFYARARNPMYFGYLVILFGTALLTGNIIGFIFPVIFFLVMNYMFIPYEEETMERIFGQEYKDYKKRTRRWF